MNLLKKKSDVANVDPQIWADVANNSDDTTYVYVNV